MVMKAYFDVVKNLVSKIEETQSATIARLAERIADSVEKDGVLHIFGSGHSHMIGEDAFHRAGGLACINAMLEESLMETNSGRATVLERLPGYAEVLMAGYDLRAGEVIVIISNSGINAVPIEMAFACKQKGLYVVAITNLDHSKQVQSRHSSGKRLFEIADVVLDNCGVLGDAEIGLDGLEQKIGPTSTLSGVLIMQLLIAEITGILQSRGITPPVFLSQNCSGGDEHNEKLVERYKGRVRYL
ncbi:sugar isomerase domain-containing protein [Paenibacillus contaminans]|nr:SIS domain-containing protein [Paenibacillus contaminans]